MSFLALHLTYTSARVSVYDPRPDLAAHMESLLPLYLPPTQTVDVLLTSKRLTIAPTLADAVRAATIIQEQGPENLGFKQRTWSEVLASGVASTAHLWSSTSGIPASQQLAHLPPGEEADAARRRLLVVHPFNPPHIMPLLELVPSPTTSADEGAFARIYFGTLASGHRPVVLQRETPGFVANRLSFVLFREACALVDAGVVSVADCDEIVRASLGPRWAVGGPFRMYAFGGGNRGMRGFLDNIGEAIDGVWRDAADLSMGLNHDGRSSKDTAAAATAGWKDKVIGQTDDAYGLPGEADIKKRDRALKAVIRLQDEQRQE